MAQRKHLRIYDLLRRLGHTGTEDEIAERISAAKCPAAGASVVVGRGRPRQ